MKRNIVFITVILLVITLSSCGCKHEWKDATCLEPQICSLCEEVQGEPLGHRWLDATCLEPQICSVCEETLGDPLGHTTGEFEFKENDYVKATAVYIKKCTVCGEDAESIEENLETLHNGELFQLSPDEFRKRLKQVYANIDEDIEIRSGTNGDQFVCGYFRDSKQLGFIQFSNEEGNITTSQKYEACFDSIMGIISDDISDVISSLVLTCDPTQTETDALAIALSICATGEEKNVNGIVYQCRVNGEGGGMVWVDIQK